MQPHVKTQASDEEEDLESLRLAALQTIKRSLPSCTNTGLLLSKKQFTSNKKSNKRGRGCHSGTRHRNGLFGHRIRNSTLIAVPTVESETCDVRLNNKSTESSSKLILPQDRYCNKQVTTEQKLEVSSKFDRYNDSESDSESDLEVESSSKLERSDSLEALMQELENEIQGDTKKIDAEKQSTSSDSLQKSEISTEKPQANVEKQQVNKVSESKEELHNIKRDIKPVEPVKAPVETSIKNVPIKKEKSPKHQWVENSAHQNPIMPFSNMQVSYPPIPFLNFNTSPCSAAPFDPHLAYNFPVINSVETQPPFRYTPNYERSISPLALSTDILNTITAPLSPRSAAFVLQNREIIERRKKSPRRSYSRSPSPRYRRSNSRSTSPVRQRLSPVNNVRRVPNYKRSPPSRYSSPKRCRRSLLHHSDPRPTSSPTKDNEVKEQTHSRGSSLSLSPSPERFDSKKLSEDKKATDDPVLEARRKKFESDAIPTEGIIRLKPKSEQNGQLTKDDVKDDKNENLEDSDSKEDELLANDDTYIDFNLKVDDLFSDEESDNENEGRFKSKSSVASVKPSTQFTNGVIMSSLKTESNSEKIKEDGIQSYSSSKYERHTERERDKARVYREISKTETTKKVSVKAVSAKNKSHIPSIDNKKIEIKIRNPTKYDTDDQDYAKIDSGGSKDKKDHSRKVEVSSEIVTERMLQSGSDDNEIDDGLSTSNNEGSGDLRAQLSRKRAERQHMMPKVENIPSRLLQTALQGAVFKKLKKVKSKKKEKDLSSIDNEEDNNYAAVRSTSVTNGYGVADINCSTANTERKVRLLHCDSESITTASDGKLPIHLRLGIPGSVGIFNESKVQKKKSVGKRSKSRANYEQV